MPRVTYLNPIAGLSIDIPEDWEMGTGSIGNTFIALDGDQTVGVCWTQPVLWFLRSKQPPEKTAQELATVFKELSGVTVTPRATGKPDEWELAFTSTSNRGSLKERWLCRQDNNTSYVIGAQVRTEYAAAAQADIDAALASCQAIARPKLQRFLEPTENAYRMLLPEGWKWEGRVFRSEMVPGYFTWKVQSPDGLTGAFSAPPGTFNIMTPYIPAGEAARQFLLPALQQQVPDVRLEKVQQLPRPGAYYCDLIKALGLGNNPRVDKARADFVGTANGTPVRIRCNVGTFMLDASPLLGGRGNWALMCSGAWAPVERFDEQFPIGRGVIGSLLTDENWKNNQFEAVNEVTVWKAWIRRWRQFLFNLFYLEAEESAPND